MMIKRVWTVEAGEYSDYHIVGVYSTLEGANDVVRALGEGEVVERVCDPGLAEIRAGLRAYLVHMRRDGYVEVCQPADLQSYDIGGSASIWNRSTAPAYAGMPVVDVLTARVFARDEAQAVKAVNEKRARMIAMNEWPESTAPASRARTSRRR